MKILLICASMNDPSNAEILADSFAEGIADGGGESEKMRLRTLHIDHFEIRHYDKRTDQGEDFRMLEQKITEADGVVIASPVWNFSVPAQLKNLIDRMGSFALDDERIRGTLGGKPFYLILTGGTSMNAWKGITRTTTSFLPVAIRFFGGTVIGTHYEPKCTAGKGVFRLVVDQRPESLASAKEQGKKFAAVVRRFRETGKLPAEQAFLKHFYRWGQRIYARFFLR